MTYFNPQIFNRENLKEQDRKELDYWNDTFINVIENCKEYYEVDDGTLGQIKKEVVEDFCKLLRVNLGVEMQENVAGIINNYEEDVELREEHTDYFYKEEK